MLESKPARSISILIEAIPPGLTMSAFAAHTVVPEHVAFLHTFGELLIVARHRVAGSGFTIELMTMSATYYI